LISKIYQKIRNHTIQKKYKLIYKYSNQNTLLNIDCGTGEFLDTSNKARYECIGVEPDLGSRKAAIENY